MDRLRLTFRPRWRATPRALLAAALLAVAQAQAAAPTGPLPATPLEQAVALYQQGQVEPAARLFERLAQQGVPAADYNLAVMHLKAELPGATPEQAVQRMTRAAERGFVTAMAGLARLYERGEAGLPRDLARAHQWHLKAAQAGSPDEQVEAGTGFYLGRGTPRDYAQAAHWYREAARRGDGGAQYLIASMYEEGLGVERDLRLARYWYALCARGGDVAAAGKLRELEARLGSSEAP